MLPQLDSPPEDDQIGTVATARRGPVVPILAISGLAAALLAETLIRIREFPGAAHLVGIGLLYTAWWIALTGAVSRVSGAPVRWFTIFLPITGGIFVLIGELATAMDQAAVGEAPSSLALLLMFAAPLVTAIAAHKKKMQWKSGLAAWSLLLYQAAVSIAGLSGILFGTYGDESRADELVFVAVIPPLIALLVATAAAPDLTTRARLSAGVLVLIAVPSVFLSTSDGGPGLLLAIFVFGCLLLIVDAIGRSTKNLSASAGLETRANAR